MFFSYCEAEMPLIYNILNRSFEGRKVTIFFTNRGVLAGVANDNMFISSDINVPGGLGVILHEGTHFVQNYKNSHYGFVDEGLADFVRYKLGNVKENNSDWAIGCVGNQDYSYGYGCAAAFFLWIEDYCEYPNIQMRLDKMENNQEEIYSVLNEICGNKIQNPDKPLAELWTRYKATNPPERIYPIYV